MTIPSAQSLPLCVGAIWAGVILMCLDVKSIGFCNKLRRRYEGRTFAKVTDVQKRPNRGAWASARTYSFQSSINNHNWDFKRPAAVRYRKNAVVPLYYNPDNPADNMLGNEYLPWYSPWFFFIGAFVVALGGFGLLPYLCAFIRQLSLPGIG